MLPNSYGTRLQIIKHMNDLKAYSLKLSVFPVLKL